MLLRRQAATGVARTCTCSFGRFPSEFALRGPTCYLTRPAFACLSCALQPSSSSSPTTARRCASLRLSTMQCLRRLLCTTTAAITSPSALRAESCSAPRCCRSPTLVTPTSCRRSPSRPLKAALRRRGPFPFSQVSLCMTPLCCLTSTFLDHFERNLMSMTSA